MDEELGNCRQTFHVSIRRNKANKQITSIRKDRINKLITGQLDNLIDSFPFSIPQLLKYVSSPENGKLASSYIGNHLFKLYPLFEQWCQLLTIIFIQQPNFQKQFLYRNQLQKYIIQSTKLSSQIIVTVFLLLQNITYRQLNESQSQMIVYFSKQYFKQIPKTVISLALRIIQSFSSNKGNEMLLKNLIDSEFINTLQQIIKSPAQRKIHKAIIFILNDLIAFKDQNISDHYAQLIKDSKILATLSHQFQIMGIGQQLKIVRLVTNLNSIYDDFTEQIVELGFLKISLDILHTNIDSNLFSDSIKLIISHLDHLSPTDCNNFMNYHGITKRFLIENGASSKLLQQYNFNEQ